MQKHRFFQLVLFSLATLVGLTQAVILSSSFVTDPSINSQMLPPNKALVKNSNGQVLYKLAANTTHGYLAAYTINSATGVLTFRNSVYNTLYSYSRPFLPGCSDVAGYGTIAVYVVCYSTVVNASLTEPGRVMILDPVTFAPKLGSVSQTLSASSPRGPKIAFHSRNGVNSLAVATGSSQIISYAAVTGTGSLGSSTTASSTPNSDGVTLHPYAAMWFGRSATVPGQDLIRAIKRVNGVIDNIQAAVSSALGSVKCVDWATNYTSLLAVVKPLTSPLFVLRLTPVTYGAFNLKPAFSGSTFDYSLPATDNATACGVPLDDKGAYVLTPTTLLEYTRNTSLTSNLFLQTTVTTVSSSLTDANGMAFSDDAASVYVSQSTGVTRYARDVATTPAVVTLPVASGRYNRLMLSYTLPEVPTNMSIVVRLVGTTTYTLLMRFTQSISLDVPLTSVFASSNGDVLSIAGGSTIAVDTYTVQVTYQDLYGNDAATTTVTGVVFDFATETPTLTTPASSAVYKSTAISVSYTLSEAMSTVTLVFSNTDAVIVWTAASGGRTVGTKSVTVNAASVSSGSTSGIFSSSTASAFDGVFDVFLNASDTAGNPAALSATKTSVVIRSYTRAPVWVTPPSSYAVFQSTSVSWVYSLPTAATAGSVVMTFVPRTGSQRVMTMAYTGGSSGTQTKPFDITAPLVGGSVTSGTAATAGEYNITLQYQDDTGNAVNSSTVRNVVVGLSSLVSIQAGLHDGDINDILTFNVTVPLPTVNGQLIIGFVNANYSRNVTIANYDASSQFFMVVGLNVSADPLDPGAVTVRGGYAVSSNPSGRFPTRFLDQYYTMIAYAPDYAGRFTIATVIATNVMLSTPFCWFRLPCRTIPVLTGACVPTQTIERVVYVDVDTGETVTQNITQIEYRDREVIVYVNGSLAPGAGTHGSSGCSADELAGYLSAIVVLAVALLATLFMLTRVYCANNGYSKLV